MASKFRVPSFQKISWKLTVLYALLFSGVLLILSIAVLVGVRWYLLDQAYGTVLDIANETASNIVDAGAGFDPRDEDLLGAAQVNTDVNVSIALPDGKIVNDSGNFHIPDNNLLTKPGVARRLHTGGYHIMVLNTEVSDGEKIIARAQAALNLQSADKFLSILFLLLGIADMLGIALSVVAGYAVARRMLRPIDRITRTANGIGIRDLAARIPVGTADDEISRLAKTINAMLDRLKDTVERQSRFVSDASHELRTPIAAIMGYAGLLERWGKDDRSVLEESVKAINAEASSMRELTERLLILARSDSGALKPKREPFDLSELIHEVAGERKMLAQGVQITVQTPEILEINADRTMLKQTLRNLVDNAVKYGKQGGAVELTAEADSGVVRIGVRDHGVGIPPGEIDRIFDRFYRVDRARSKDAGGSGLGLPIVRSIVEAHGGSIDMQSAPGKGTNVVIVLPQG